MADEKKKSTTAADLPSYESMFGRLKQIKEQSSNPLIFSKKVCDVASDSILFTIGLLCNSVIPFVGIIIGGIYINECSIDNNIPIWLIVYGVFGVFSAVLRGSISAYESFKRKKDAEYQMHVACNFKSIIELFLFIWLIVGSVWVYKYYGKVDYSNLDSLNYCQKTVYLYSFAVITLYWCVIGLACFCLCLFFPLFMILSAGVLAASEA